MALFPILKTDRTGVIAWLILIVFSYLSLLNLGAIALWDDESVQAFITHNLLQTGTATAFDGRNLFTNGNGNYITADLKQAYPQLVYYTTALGFWALGESPASGRLVSGLFGIAAMIVMWRILRREFATRPRLALMAFALTCFSPIILLHVRQLQYYAVSLFFNLLFFWLYLVYLEKRRAWLVAVTTIVAILSFHANYLVFAAFLISVAATHFLFCAHTFTRRDYLFFTLAGIILATAALPSLVFVDGFVKSDDDFMIRISRALVSASAAIMGLNRNNVLPWPILLWSFWFIVKQLRETNNAPSPTTKNWATMLRAAGNDPVVRYTVITLIFTLVVGTVISFHSYYHWRTISARYLVPIMPFAAVTCAAAAGWLMKKAPPLWGKSLFIIMLFSNLLSAPFIYHVEYGNKPLLTLPLLVREIHQANRFNGVSYSVNYLAEQAQQNDNVLTIPFHYANPLRYYLGNKILICCLLDADSHLYERFKQYPHLLRDKSIPEWVISYGLPLTADKLSSLRKKTGKRYPLVATFPIYENGFHPQRPEPVWHVYPFPKSSRGNRGVYIYQAAPTNNMPAIPEKSPVTHGGG